MTTFWIVSSHFCHKTYANLWTLKKITSNQFFRSLVTSRLWRASGLEIPVYRLCVQQGRDGSKSFSSTRAEQNTPLAPIRGLAAVCTDGFRTMYNVWNSKTRGEHYAITGDDAHLCNAASWPQTYRSQTYRTQTHRTHQTKEFASADTLARKLGGRFSYSYFFSMRSGGSTMLWKQKIVAGYFKSSTLPILTKRSGPFVPNPYRDQITIKWPWEFASPSNKPSNVTRFCTGLVWRTASWGVSALGMDWCNILILPVPWYKYPSTRMSLKLRDLSTGEQQIQISALLCLVFDLSPWTLLFVESSDTKSTDGIDTMDPAANYFTLDLLNADITQLQGVLAKGLVTSTELVKRYLERIEKVNKQGPELNAVIEINPDAIDIAQQLDNERESNMLRGDIYIYFTIAFSVEFFFFFFLHQHSH